MHFDRLYHGHMRPITRASRPRSRFLADAECLVKAVILVLLAILAVDGIGHVLGYASFVLSQWGVRP